MLRKKVTLFKPQKMVSCKLILSVLKQEMGNIESQLGIVPAQNFP